MAIFSRTSLLGLLANVFIPIALANEYDTTTSIFTPKVQGIYSIIGIVDFVPSIPNSTYTNTISIFVNGGLAVAYDVDFMGTTAFVNVVNVNAILQLNAGDQVHISVAPQVAGSVRSRGSDGSTGTSFQVARFPY
ncbi:ABC transporter permease [Paenibacillus hodogayensis]|uniref:ABC transporter permease n=1 Tax=Paenibacillus hodogayensis TaxID=279208 RepID=A0ABV5VPF8_9BACL